MMTKTVLIALFIAVASAPSAFAVTANDCPHVVKVPPGSKLASHIGPVSLTRSTTASNPDDLGYIHLNDACQTVGDPMQAAQAAHN